MLLFVKDKPAFSHFHVQKLGQLLAEFVQTFRPAAKMVSIAGLLTRLGLLLSCMYACLH